MGELRKDCFAVERQKREDGEYYLSCSALSETLCITRNKCSFYMSRQDKIARDNKLRERDG